MEHQVVTLEAFNVIGIGLDCKQEDVSGIGPMWEKQFFPRWKDLNPTGRIVGVSFGRPGGFRYMAAAAMPADAAVPSGMEAATVPAGKYVKVRFVGKPQEMPATFDAIYGKLLPAEGLTSAAVTICLEDYPHDCMDEATGTLTCDLLVLLA